MDISYIRLRITTIVMVYKSYKMVTDKLYQQADNPLYLPGI